MTREVTTATKLKALSTKHQPVPTVAMSTPAIAGPTARAAFTMVELRLTALRRSAGPTISRTKAWREGFSKQLLSPRTTARMQTIEERHVVGQREGAEHRRLDAHGRLKHHHQAPLVDPVGDHTRVGTQQEYRQRLEGDDQPEILGRPGQGEDEPGLGRGLHPGADERDRLADEVPPVIRNGESREGATHAGQPHCG